MERLEKLNTNRNANTGKGDMSTYRKGGKGGNISGLCKYKYKYNYRKMRGEAGNVSGLCLL